VHPDVLIVEPGDSGSIKLDQVRDIVDRVAYRPFEGQRRVVIIDEADALVASAQNALLKTLEEPPPSSIFILITSRSDMLLPTVRSRCLLLRFRPLATEDVADALVKQGRTASEARAIAATADGSVGHALGASADDVAEAREVAALVLAEAASVDDPKRRVESARHLLAGAGKSSAQDRELVAGELRAMASLLRDIELISVCSDTLWLANPDLKPALSRLNAYRGDRGVRAFAAVDEALAAVERNAGIKIVADWLVLQL
jgi:DNA polymerase-3 subunit delta'